jgi:hypothetical protein
VNNRLLLLAAAALVPTAAWARPVNLHRTVFVTPVAGNPVASGTRLLNALADITTASDADPWLVKLEPGVYDLHGRSLAMKPHVDVEGSGTGVTAIRSTVESLGTVAGADFAELRAVTVWNEAASRAVALRNQAVFFTARGVDVRARGGSEFSVAVSSTAAGGVFIDVNALAQDSPAVTGMSSSGGLLTRVRASATGGGSFAYGLFNQASGGEANDVTALAQGSSYAAAIRNESGAPILRGVRAVAAGANISEGIVNGGGTAARIQDAVIDVTGGADFSAGIRNENSTAVVTHATAAVAGANSAFGATSLLGGTLIIRNAAFKVTAGGSGVGIQGGDGAVVVEASTIESDWLALRGTGPGSAIRVGASRLAGGVDAAGGAIQCAASYDGSFAALGANCLP